MICWKKGALNTFSYQKCMDARLQLLNSSNAKPDVTYSAMVKLLQSCTELNCPKAKGTTNKRFDTWWCVEIEALWKTKNRLRKKSYRSKKSTDRFAFLSAQKVLRAMIRKKKTGVLAQNKRRSE